jgi:hypothetical protein
MGLPYSLSRVETGNIARSEPKTLMGEYDETPFEETVSRLADK